MTNIEDLIHAARQHGLEDDPDHEVGDLQDILRAAWEIMTPDQRTALMQSGLALNLEEFTA